MAEAHEHQGKNLAEAHEHKGEQWQRHTSIKEKIWQRHASIKENTGRDTGIEESSINDQIQRSLGYPSSYCLSFEILYLRVVHLRKVRHYPSPSPLTSASTASISQYQEGMADPSYNHS
jgi:hypothetical protein